MYHDKDVSLGQKMTVLYERDDVRGIYLVILRVWNEQDCDGPLVKHAFNLLMESNPY